MNSRLQILKTQLEYFQLASRFREALGRMRPDQKLLVFASFQTYPRHEQPVHYSSLLFLLIQIKLDGWP